MPLRWIPNRPWISFRSSSTEGRNKKWNKQERIGIFVIILQRKHHRWFNKKFFDVCRSVLFYHNARTYSLKLDEQGVRRASNRRLPLALKDNISIQNCFLLSYRVWLRRVSLYPSEGTSGQRKDKIETDEENIRLFHQEHTIFWF